MNGMDRNPGPCAVELIMFDFGGVIAEEGFRNGLRAIALKNSLNPEAFVKEGFELVHSTGYVTGRSDEKAYWQALREKTGIQIDDESLRKDILIQFAIRPWMMRVVKRLKEQGQRMVILSDQTNWLDELDATHHFSRWFDQVFNSFHSGKSKRDPSAFDDALHAMGVEAGKVLFVDDHPGNIERAREKGIHTILYENVEGFMEELGKFCPNLQGGAKDRRQRTDDGKSNDKFQNPNVKGMSKDKAQMTNERKKAITKTRKKRG
jgi:HAD superfamily hydrolase (TIGR01509 family)